MGGGRILESELMLRCMRRSWLLKAACRQLPNNNDEQLTAPVARRLLP